MTTDLPVLEPGYPLGGRYTLGAIIASGGMGDVWEATDEVLARPVAVKVLRPSGDDESFTERFHDEARHTAGLHHPNIAAVYDYGEDGGLAFLVMELVPGQTLAEVIRETGGLEAQQVRSVIGQAALALSAAHEAGVVHRDVKPGNIIITPEGQAKLTDFGIARAGEGSGRTLTGEVLGTPDYLSPEQAIGEPATIASDLYSLGIVAHEMLTGTKPFDRGTPVATALAQVNDPPPALPDTVPADLRSVIEACLAKSAGDRPPDARAVAESLGMPLGSLPGVTPPPGDVHTVAMSPIPVTDTTRDATRAMTVLDNTPTPEWATRGGLPGSEPRGRDGRRRLAAWLAVPLVALLAWGAFALGSAMNRGTSTTPPTTPGVAATTSKPAPTATSAPSATTTTARTTPPATVVTPAGEHSTAHGKGKGKNK
jgi:serine/threonine-protein kinase